MEGEVRMWTVRLRIPEVFVETRDGTGKQAYIGTSALRGACVGVCFSDRPQVRGEQTLRISAVIRRYDIDAWGDFDAWVGQLPTECAVVFRCEPINVEPEYQLLFGEDIAFAHRRAEVAGHVHATPLGLYPGVALQALPHTSARHLTPLATAAS